MLRATLIGLIAAVIWGASVSFYKLFAEQVGGFMALGLGVGGAALINILYHQTKQKTSFDRNILRSRWFYVRWMFFVFHETALAYAMYLVDRNHVPFVLLINYLWPTAIILCSILIAGVKITRKAFFVLGSMTILVGLTFEIMGPDGLSVELFSNPTNCLAYLLTFLGAISWGLYCAITRQYGTATENSSTISIFQASLLLCVVVSIFAHEPGISHLTGGWLFYLACLSLTSFIAYLSWDFGVRKGNLVILSLGADFIPWLSLFAAHIIFASPIESHTIAAAIAIVAGAMITRYGTMPRKSLQES